ncbi:MAG: hypothetical protein ABEJ99_00360 [Candidatus Nanohaloarchaea archaeon]
MKLDISDAVREGFHSTFTDRGIVFIGIFFLINILSTFVGVSVMNNMQMFPTPYFYHMVYTQIPRLSWSIFQLALGLASIVATIAALRSFVEDKKIDQDLFERRIGIATLNFIIGSIAFGLLVAFGLVFFIIPGIFIFVSLIMWTVYISVEDENFIEAMGSSWDMVKGDRLRLFALGIVVILIEAAVSIVLGLPALVFSNAATVLVSQVTAAFGTVFGISILAEAYNQLK